MKMLPTADDVRLLFLICCISVSVKTAYLQNVAPPVISNCPLTIFVSSSPNKAYWVEPTVTSNADSVILISNKVSGSYFNSGQTQVIYIATDEWGQQADCSFTVSVSATGIPIVGNCPSSITVQIPEDETSASVSWIPPFATDPDVPVIRSSNYEPGDEFPIGDTTVIYTFVDNTELGGVCEFQVLVQDPIDDVAPIFTYCPSDRSVYTPEGTSNTAISWTLPEATDNSDSVVYSSTHFPGNAFPEGSTTVVYTARDPSDNEATCSFTLTVLVNNRPSTSNCPSSRTISTDPGLNTAVVTWVEPTFTDELGQVPTTGSRQPGATFQMGVNLISYTATDLTGLEGSCVFIMTVEDTEEPQIVNCPSDITKLVASGTASATVTWTIPTATDNDDVTTFVSNYNSPVELLIGNHPIVYLATDPSGNSRQCTFTITISETPPPSFSNFPSDQTVNTLLGQAIGIVSWTVPSATSSVGGEVIVTSDFEPGTVYPIGTTTVTYTAEDSFGAVTTEQFDVIVIDEESPQIANCPSDMTQYVDVGTSSTIITWTEPTATDNHEIFSLVSNYDTPAPLAPGDYNVLYVAKDPSGNSAECSFEINIIETQPPVFINFPTDQTVNTFPGEPIAVVTWAAPSATSLLGGQTTLTSDYQPGEVFSIGTTTVTYTAEDNFGAVAIGQFDVIVIDAENPEISNCPSDMTEFKASGTPSITVTWIEPTASDNDEVFLLISNYDTPASLTAGSYSVLYVAKDPSGNSAECAFQITIIESQAPVFVNFPDDQYISTDPGEPTATVTWIEPSVTYSFDPAPTVTSNYQSGDVFPIGVTTVTYRAEDSLGVITTGEFTIRVYDGEEPQILNCPEDIFVYVAASVTSTPVTWIPPTAIDNDRVVTFVSNYRPPPQVFNRGDREVVYVATDPAGNFEDCTFTITVTERSPPVFTSFPTNKIAHASPGLATGIVTWEEPTVSYDADPAPTVVSSHSSADLFPIGTTTVTYTAVDSFGLVLEDEFTVRIIDIEDPVILNCPAPMTAYAPSDGTNSVTWTLPTAVDNSGTVNLIGNHESGDEFNVGVHLITYIAIDGNNNQVSCTFVLTVEEDTPPVLSNLPPAQQTVNTDPGEPSAVVSWDTPVATDDRGIPTITVNIGSGSAFPIGSTTVTITATDNEGLTDVFTFNVNVIDAEDPIISGCNDVTVVAQPGNATTRAYWTPPTASDNSGDVTVTSNGNPGDQFAVGTTSIGYLAVDGSNNQATCAVNVIVRELGYPVFTNCPSAIFEETDPGDDRAVVTWDEITATDELDSPTVTSNYDSGSWFGVGTTTVIYMATDSDGLSATCSFDVSVSDLEDPVILNCPSDISLYIVDTSKTARVWWDVPVATDNLGHVEISSSDTPGDSFPEGESIVLYVAQDSARNSDSCSFSVRLLIPSRTNSYESSVNLDRIGGNILTSNSNIDVLEDEVTSDLDTYLRSSLGAGESIARRRRSTTIGDEYVGVDDAELKISTSLGIATLKFTLYMTQDSSYSTSRIENVFDNYLSGSGAFASGNRVVQSSFLVGPGECADNPCDRGTCERVGRNDFYCSCPDGWSGATCADDINECDDDPCGENFLCVNSQGSYSCICSAGYYQDGDVCVRSRNFASCFDLERVTGEVRLYEDVLSDPRNTEYQLLAAQVKAAIDSVYSDLTDFFESSIVSFTAGSNILVCYQVHFHGDSFITEESVLEELMDDVANDGEITDSTVYLKRSSLEHTNEVCPLNYCNNGGDCYLDTNAVVNREAVVSACQCNGGYNGVTCSEVTIFTTFVIIIITVVGFIILILLLLLFICCWLTLNEDEKKSKYTSHRDLQVPNINIEHVDDRVHVVDRGPVNPNIEGVEMGVISRSPSCVSFVDQGVARNEVPATATTQFQLEEDIPPPPSQPAPPPPPPPPPGSPPPMTAQPATVYIQEQPQPVTMLEPMQYVNYPEPMQYTNYPPVVRQRSISPQRRVVVYDEAPRSSKRLVRVSRKSRKSRKPEKVLVTSYPDGYQEVVREESPERRRKSRKSRKSKRLVPVGSVKPSRRATQRVVVVEPPQKERGSYYNKGYDGPIEEVALPYLEDGFRADAINPVTSGPRFIALNLNESFMSSNMDLDVPGSPPPHGLQSVPEHQPLRTPSYPPQPPPPPLGPPPPPAFQQQGPAFQAAGYPESEPPTYSSVDRQASHRATEHRALQLARAQQEKDYLPSYGTAQRTPSMLVREHDAVYQYQPGSPIPPKIDEEVDEGYNYHDDFF